MKKILLLLVLGILLLSACRKSEEEVLVSSEIADVDFLLNEIGNSFTETLDNNDIDKDISIEERRPGEFLLPNKLSYAGNLFDIYVETRDESQLVTGGVYELSFTEDTPSDELIQVFNEAVKGVEERHGWPSTSDKLETTEQMRADPEGFLTEKGGIYEVWDLGTGRLDAYPDFYTGIWIHLDYQPGNDIYLLRIEYHVIKSPYM